MNDVSYENFFGGANVQFSDSLPLVFANEHDLSENTHYLNTAPSDLSLPSAHQLLNFSHPSNQEAQQQVNGTRYTVLSSNNSGEGSTVSGIPFVQIHTTDVQPRQNGFNHNVFRRNPEIKAEPIKAENADAIKDRVNSTPTPPVRSTCSSVEAPSKAQLSEIVCVLRESVETHVNAGEETAQNDDEPVEGLPTFLTVLKCKNCAFICLSEASLEFHTSNASCNDNTNRPHISCPGCENKFYTQLSLEIHLREDHLMPSEDVSKFLNATQTTKPTTSSNHHQSEIETIEVPNTQDSHPKSRIYLRNVECLREPRREPIEQMCENYLQTNGLENICNTLMNAVEDTDIIRILDDVNLEDGDTSDATHPAHKAANPVKQKISIKSVDVLREPALLQREYGMQNFNNFLSTCNDFELGALCGNEILNYATNNDSNNKPMCTNEANDTGDLSTFEGRRRPKIYIKNVDILKEPLLLPTNLNLSNTQNGNNTLPFSFLSQSIPQVVNDFQSNAETINEVPQVFEENINQMPMTTIPTEYIYENANNNFTPASQESDYSFVNTQGGSNFVVNSELETAKISTTPVTTEPTPPPILQEQMAITHNTIEHALNTAPGALQPPKQKIFIKNVDILKEPQFQEQRGVLHLRTVDELNLMNRNEVKNLITPNLDNSQNITTQNEPEQEQEHNHEHFAHLTQNQEMPVGAANENPNLKVHEFTVNSWGEEYDLGEDIDCIITNTVANLNGNNNGVLPSTQRTLFDLDTPQMSLISIRDIEELTGGHQTINIYANSDVEIENNNNTLQLFDDQIVGMGDVNDISIPVNTETHGNSCTIDYNSAVLDHQSEVSESENPNLKEEVAAVPNGISEETMSAASNSPVSHFDDIPPLVPVTNKTVGSNESFASPTSNICNANAGRFNALRMPPLVPVSSGSFPANRTAATVHNAPAEKGRIYVASNLIAPVSRVEPNSSALPAVAVAVTGGTSVRGRPFGKQRSSNQKSQNCKSTEKELGIKCSMPGCTFRFKKPDTLEYHKSCHSSNPQGMQCPECNNNKFTNWNSLHTHLWRSHHIDMELYSCELCSFKTPIYSRLVNTHSKIHSEDRNYKCEHCSKAFKNTKQLKNHRRWHRSQTTALHQCNDCGAAFSHQKSLREHHCKKGGAQLVCEVCGGEYTSKSSLTLHLLTHNLAKRFKCDTCSFTASDHNAFRRHKMTHEENKSYKCSHCSYTCIQSRVYQKHLQQKHPDKVNSMVYKCNECFFSTINEALLKVHKAKHEVPRKSPRHNNDNSECIISLSSPEPVDSSSSGMEQYTPYSTKAKQSRQVNKIKVKSNLLLQNPTSLIDLTNTESNLPQVLNSVQVHVIEN